jgi:hypothetical protein
LWNSVGDPGPENLTVMREADLDSLEMPTIDPPALFTIVRTVRLWIDEEGWGVLNPMQPTDISSSHSVSA